MSDVIERMREAASIAFREGWDGDWIDLGEDLERAMIAAALQAAEREGFALVPVDPTPSMISAASKAMSPGRRPTPDRVSVREKHAIRWRAMINAAIGDCPSKAEADKGTKE